MRRMRTLLARTGLPAAAVRQLVNERASLGRSEHVSNPRHHDHEGLTRSGRSGRGRICRRQVPPSGKESPVPKRTLDVAGPAGRVGCPRMSGTRIDRLTVSVPGRRSASRAPPCLVAAGRFPRQRSSPSRRESDPVRARQFALLPTTSHPHPVQSAAEVRSCSRCGRSRSSSLIVFTSPA